MNRRELKNRRVLVVEDDWFIAGYVSEALEQAGAAVIGPLPSREAALELLSGDRPCAATLNVRLFDGDSLPVARRLDELDVPFLFLSANADAGLPPELQARPRLQKPFAAWEVIEAVGGMLDR